MQGIGIGILINFNLLPQLFHANILSECWTVARVRVHRNLGSILCHQVQMKEIEEMFNLYLKISFFYHQAKPNRVATTHLLALETI